MGANDKSLEQEINKRKKAEHELKAVKHHLNTIIEKMPAGIAILEGPDFRYESINQKLADMNGISVSNHIGKTLAEILPDAEPFIAPGLRKTIETNKPTPNREFSTIMPNDPNNVRWFLDSFFPINDLEGEPYAVAAVVLDITIRKEAEIALQKTNTELKKSTRDLMEANEKLKSEIEERARAEKELLKTQQQLAHVLRVATVGEMGSGIAHEINQPLSVIVNYTNGCIARLENGTLNNDSLKGVLQRISSASLRCGEIIKRLRNLISKGASNKELFNVNNVINDSMELMISSIREVGVAINLHLEENLADIFADKIQFSQAFINILTNALEAMNSKNVIKRIDISTRALDDFIELDVRDYGSGISPSKEKLLFEPYYSTKPSGLGMGLSISRTIIESMCGSIRLINYPGSGACFRIKIPV